MNENTTHYHRQLQNASTTYQNLLTLRQEIESKLETECSSINLHKDLRKVNLDITITQNEIEHIESCLLKSASLNK